MTPPWYGTANLGLYAQPSQHLAADLFQRVQALIGPTRAKIEEGSYSFERTTPSLTEDIAAKLVIYQNGINRRGDRWHPGPDGVYVLLRTEGNAGTFPFTVALRQPTNEHRRFAFFRLQDTQDRDEMARFIAACCDYQERSAITRDNTKAAMAKTTLNAEISALLISPKGTSVDWQALDSAKGDDWPKAAAIVRDLAPKLPVLRPGDTFP
jgi:hypothetical protein